jgi:hypothetical protein
MAGVYSKHRFKIFNAPQHPYIHNLADFGYINPALPGISNVEAALDYMLAVLYPQTKTAVADVASLPTVGNTINDFRVVDDDGDGKSAGYRWEKREGEVAASWHKIYDFDFGTDSILQQYHAQTQGLYVYKQGNDDLDENGVVLTTVYKGQTIYGGATAGTNLTLRANSGDGTATSTGFVQVDDNFRPAVNAVYALGSASFRFTDGYFSDSVIIDTMTLSGGSILDSSGDISFGTADLSTTGDVTSVHGYFTASVEIGTLVGNALILAPGSITDESGAISFSNENISTTGTFASGTITVSADLILASGSITSASGAISFSNENLSTTGTLSAGAGTFTQGNFDNIRLDGNTITTLDTNGNLIISANGTGKIDVQNALLTLDVTTTGTIGVTGQFNIDNLRMDGNVLSSTNADGNIVLTPNGTGLVQFSASPQPVTDAAVSLGAAAKRYVNLFLSGGVSDGTNSIAIATLLSFRDALLGASSGMVLFYDGSKWLASIPDTEIDHGSLTGLGDDDHSQYALLAGRTSGQLLYGGVNASGNLDLDSTAHATKGDIRFKSDAIPYASASYSGSWSGTDLGDPSYNWRNVYSKGEFIGFRFENQTSLPSSSSQNPGRAVWDSDDNLLYVDTGSAFIAINYKKHQSDTSWNGSDVTKDVTVSGVTDARTAMWALHDNTNDFDRIYCSLKATSVSNVRITVGTALPAGSYRLIGIQ